MIEFRTEMAKFFLTNNYYRGYRTTDNSEIKYDDALELYEYFIEYKDSEEQKLYQIKFTSEARAGSVLLQWVNYHYSTEKVKKLNQYVANKIDALTSQANENILKNCIRLKKLLQEDTFFGINVIYLDDSQNQFSSHIQILEFREYDGEQLVYCKGGVTSYNEVPIKISDYRHLLEWNPLDKTVKLTSLGIKQGQEYARAAHVVFNLSYRQETPYLQFLNRESIPDQKTLVQWVEYINCIVDDPRVLNEISGVIKAHSVPN